MRADFTHVQARQGRSLGVCVREMVCTVPCLHSSFPSIHLTNSDSEGVKSEKIKLSNSVLRSGNGAVAAKLCLEDPVGHLCLRKG